MEKKRLPVNIFERPWGTVCELISNGQFTISIEAILPGKKIGNHYHNHSKEIEVVLAGVLLINGQPTNPGNVVIWKPKEIHGYTNFHTNNTALVLTISIPRFDDNDEIFTE